MTIPGSELEPQNQPPTNDADLPNPPADETDDDLIPVEKNAKGEDVAPASAVIKWKKAAKETQRQLADLQPKIQQAEQLAQTLQRVQPLLQVLQGLTPEQRAQLQAGKLPNAGREPAEDLEAQQWADDNGLIKADGSLDVSRARKQLDYLDQRAAQMAQKVIAPLATSTAAQQAEVLRERATGMRDQQGRPLATPESIREAYAQLPAELASNPNVAHVAIGTAMLIDRLKGRTPHVTPTYDEPLFTEPAGGGRRGAVMTDDDREIAKRVGVDEKTYQQSIAQLGQMTRRGLALE